MPGGRETIPGAAVRTARGAWPSLVASLLVATTAAGQEPAPPPAVPAGAPDPAATVTLAGVVRDTAGRPLSGAEVRAGADHLALSEADGTFLLRGVPGDTIQLLVRRIGYRPADVVLAAQPGLRVELAVKLVPSVVELGTVVIEGRTMSTRLWRGGFYDRQKVGRGTFFGPEELEGHGATLSGLVREVPSVRVVHDRSGNGIAYGPASAGGHCPLNVFLDGILIRWANEIGLEQLVNRQDVLAVEVYPRATSVPSALGGYTGDTQGTGGLPSPGPGGASMRGTSTVDCGALVIWTKPVGEDAGAGRPE